MALVALPPRSLPAAAASPGAVPSSSHVAGDLPSSARDVGSLGDLSRRAAPVVLARDRLLAVPGPLGALLPGGGVARGAVVAVDGAPGAGSTSVMLGLLAAVTVLGEWVAVVDPAGVMGGGALLEAGVAGERCAVVRAVERSRWAPVVAALLEGMTLVVAYVPRGVRAGEAHRLVARARERAATLVVSGAWPAEAALRLRAEGITWSGLGEGGGHLTRVATHVRVDGRGAASRSRVSALAG